MFYWLHKSEGSISSFMNDVGLLTAKQAGGGEPSIFWILIFASNYKRVSYKKDMLRFRRVKWSEEDVCWSSKNLYEAL